MQLSGAVARNRRLLNPNTDKRAILCNWVKEGPVAVRSAVVSIVTSVCLSVHPYKLTRPPPNGHIFVKFYIWGIFENLTRKSNFGWNLRKFADTLYEDVCAFVVISRWILLRIRKISEKECKKIGTTFDVFMHEYGSLDGVILGDGNRSTVRGICPAATRRILLKFRKL